MFVGTSQQTKSSFLCDLCASVVKVNHFIFCLIIFKMREMVFHKVEEDWVWKENRYTDESIKLGQFDLKAINWAQMKIMAYSLLYLN